MRHWTMFCCLAASVIAAVVLCCGDVLMSHENDTMDPPSLFSDSLLYLEGGDTTPPPLPLDFAREDAQGNGLDSPGGGPPPPEPTPVLSVKNQEWYHYEIYGDLFPDEAQFYWSDWVAHNHPHTETARLRSMVWQNCNNHGEVIYGAVGDTDNINVPASTWVELETGRRDFDRPIYCSVFGCTLLAPLTKMAGPAPEGYTPITWSHSPSPWHLGYDLHVGGNNGVTLVGADGNLAYNNTNFVIYTSYLYNGWCLDTWSLQLGIWNTEKNKFDRCVPLIKEVSGGAFIDLCEGGLRHGGVLPNDAKYRRWSAQYNKYFWELSVGMFTDDDEDPIAMSGTLVVFDGDN